MNHLINWANAKATNPITSHFNKFLEVTVLYLINTFSNKSWKDINKETIINFLEGLDFYYLSNEAYFFIIPACIRYGIEKFENNEDLEYLVFFLSDQDRVKYADDKIKKLVVSYLELLKRLKFVVFGKEEEKCLKIWR